MKPERNGFTLVELLTVLAIIAILVGILVPTVSFVRNTAGEAKQKTQIATLDMALMAFKGDYGDYPPSELDPDNGDYCGAQKLAEALVGWDLLGFHPDSDWKAGGSAYEPPNPSDNNLDKRIGPYLESGAANAFTLGQLFGGTGIETPLALNTYVLCDSFAAKTITIGASKTITTKAGRPILYYRANRNSKNFDTFGLPDNKIYNSRDNYEVILLKKGYEGTDDPLADTAGAGTLGGSFLYSGNYKLLDQKIYEATYDEATKTGRRWPYRPDSYILISAGVDGLYGTNDDICNF
jgi:prepilin-type N-terminal cleavage/methylation domain-containing protein